MCVGWCASAVPKDTVHSILHSWPRREGIHQEAEWRDSPAFYINSPRLFLGFAGWEWQKWTVFSINNFYFRRVSVSINKRGGGGRSWWVEVRDCVRREAWRGASKTGPRQGSFCLGGGGLARRVEYDKLRDGRRLLMRIYIRGRGCCRGPCGDQRARPLLLRLPRR